MEVMDELFGIDVVLLVEFVMDMVEFLFKRWVILVSLVF